ncbi:hypothetical protein DL766_009339 [Monosporascus sp. MC13-8B]|uniref:Major facilitator superfamily (MFS) profile domain-containing protein n=1 Tax=Monosporascus cannonballus TaxID=155416 RepID=A0ABY0GYA5_9PEZI|nr:hypothetical protein DL763_009041 [Monosporascus cannonballus]RYO80279.1 hypothetical protein DL762_007726 [Monosporascus cannonballus]RYP15696.1 hypothetical protein DL766_009339 [Monosporascus sp. MC13-8B]
MLPHATSQQLGWITTLAEFFMLGAGVLMGHLVDTYGTRVVIAPFAAISVLALGLLSVCTEYWQVLLCQGVLLGIACSGTTLPSIVCVTQWFSTRKGLAVGLASSGSSIGGLFFPIMVTRLLASQGFAVAAWTAFCAGGFFCMLTLLVPYNYLPMTAVAGGMNARLAQYTVAIANGGSTIGRVLPGFLSDRWGQFNVMITVSAASAVSILAIWLPLAHHASEAGTLFFAAFYGFVSGGYTRVCNGYPNGYPSLPTT